MASRNYRIDNMKAVLIILVVIGHFLLPVSSTRFTTNSQYLIYSFHMPAFVFLSGYLAKGVYRNGKFRWEKAFRLAWLYILFEIGVHITEGLLAGHIGWKIDFFHESGAPWYLLAMVFLYSDLCISEKMESNDAGTGGGAGWRLCGEIGRFSGSRPCAGICSVFLWRIFLHRGRDESHVRRNKERSCHWSSHGCCSSDFSGNV